MRNSPLAPSTKWQERVDPREAARYAAHADVFAEIQARKSAQFGPGRALHRKQVVAAAGTLEVLDGLPPFAREGLFEEPRDYEVWVRVSNGGFDSVADRVPDIRGFSIRVFGVEGESALGGPARHQDFTLINQEAFGFTGSAEFVDFVAAASHGHGALLGHLVRTHGLLGAPQRLFKLLKATGKPFHGFATEAFHSAVPIANGAYAVRVRLVPSPANGASDPNAREDWTLDFSQRLRARPLHWDLQLQFFANEAATPIEDASVPWPTPYTTVARLMLPRQDPDAFEGKELASKVEAGVFDPWQALAAHRPLGDVQRARKAVYFRSQQGRGAA